MFTDNTHLAHRLAEADNRNEEHEKQKQALTKERDNYLEKLAETKRDASFNLSKTQTQLKDELEEKTREFNTKVR
jgi:hypothetical protein